ncbi:MAG: SRPBCC family protein [Gammaproteobacteria bacterium]|nr:SRPBCC family protein [Gammaproteobacteria bacterium]MDH4312935.1 SRPBCC family protein [Gammaproteobacteria bacterium]
MKILKGLFFSILALVALFFLIALFLPQAAHLDRSMSTTASPETVYGLVDGFKRFNEWSPWANIDPATKYTYSGPETGVGARMEWASDNPDVGNGSQEVIAVEPGRRVTSKLDFGMDNPTTATISLVPEGTGTRVTWTLDTDLSGSLLGRYFGLALDHMVGPDYEQGLARLKAVAESTTPANAPPISAPATPADASVQPADAVSPTVHETPVPPIPQ